MTADPDFDLLFLGHFAVDRNVVDGVVEIAPGGGVYYGGIAAARLGARVGVVTRLRHEDFPRLDDFRQAGVEVFAIAASDTSGIENTYSSADMERRVCVPLGFAGPIIAGDLPDATACIYAITPIIAGEVDLPLLRLLAARVHHVPGTSEGAWHVALTAPPGVALDVQGFVRVRVGDQLLFRPWVEIAEGLAQVTYLKVDRAEAEALTGETDLARAAVKLAAYGPKEIVLTQSAGVMVYADGQVHFAPFTPRSLAGRTGRGDTCFATYLTKRLTCPPAEACRWAGAVTTLKQEQPGPWRGTAAGIEALLDGLIQEHKMRWYNEPRIWAATGDTLTVTADRHTDYWRKTHYGFNKDDGHLYYEEVSGDFCCDVKVTGGYATLYDQAGLMVRVDEMTWIKCGIEFVDGIQHVSAVVTRDFSDWSVVPLPNNPPALWLRLTRTGAAVEISYALDGSHYSLLRLAYLSEAQSVQVGVMCAAPQGEGFPVTFEGFAVKR